MILVKNHNSDKQFSEFDSWTISNFFRRVQHWVRLKRIVRFLLWLFVSFEQIIIITILIIILWCRITKLLLLFIIISRELPGYERVHMANVQMWRWWSNVRHREHAMILGWIVGWHRWTVHSFELLSLVTVGALKLIEMNLVVVAIL